MSSTFWKEHVIYNHVYSKKQAQWNNKKNGFNLRLWKHECLIAVEPQSSGHFSYGVPRLLISAVKKDNMIGALASFSNDY